MSVQFVAHIDESGDTGLAHVKPIDVRGATEWLVLGCYLVRVEHDSKSLGWVREIISKFRNAQSPHLHFADLIPAKRRIACELLATKPCRLFTVMSNKKNIRRYRNPNLDDGNRAWIYWWLTRILLEKVTDYCERRTPAERRGVDKLHIVFSRRGGLRYIDFSRYLSKLKRQSQAGRLYINQDDLAWSMIDEDEVRVLDHTKRAGLQLADIVAGSFFQAVERIRPGSCDAGYALALKPRMARTEGGQMLGYSVKTMPDLSEMDLQPEQRQVFEDYGYVKEGW